MLAYLQIREAVFLARPNRFIALCSLMGETVTCHVKNTGRCKELLVPGARVLLEQSDNPNRKTAFDLVAVYKGQRLINLDSQLPNAVAEEALPRLFPDLTGWKREQTFGNSRFDFYLETAGKPGYLEVKGVTLEQDDVVLFPDAPTQRGVKHLRELIACKAAGYQAWLLFVIQMEGVRYFTPNAATDPDFSAALAEAEAAGVQLLAYDCTVAPETMTLKSPVRLVQTGSAEKASS